MPEEKEVAPGILTRERSDEERKRFFSFARERDEE